MARNIPGFADSMFTKFTMFLIGYRNPPGISYNLVSLYYGPLHQIQVPRGIRTGATEKRGHGLIPLLFMEPWTSRTAINFDVQQWCHVGIHTRGHLEMAFFGRFSGGLILDEAKQLQQDVHFGPFCMNGYDDMRIDVEILGRHSEKSLVLGVTQLVATLLLVAAGHQPARMTTVAKLAQVIGSKRGLQRCQPEFASGCFFSFSMRLFGGFPKWVYPKMVGL